MTRDWEFDAVSSAFAPMSLSVACRNASLRATIGSVERGEPMLNENIRAIRKSRGLSQEELAIRLNVVRQTVSKWRWILKPAALSG